MLSDVLACREDEVHERLFCEALSTGWNVCRAAASAGVTAHIWDRAMESFYADSDAFVFKLVVSHLSAASKEIDRRVIRVVTEMHPAGLGHRLLTLGDGIGSDTVYFARAGFSVTYADYPGLSASVARWRTARLGPTADVSFVLAPEQPVRGTFEIVICREVLEHVPDPLGLAAVIAGAAVDGGVAVVTESFARVEPCFPTHLASNLVWSGHTHELFSRCGMGLIAAGPGGRPLVFRKGCRPDPRVVRALWWGQDRTVPRVARKVGRLVRGLLGAEN
jgi:SAM-dependent methyltransferase